METEIENMINGNETPEKAVESMASQINSSIEDYNLVNEEETGFTKIRFRPIVKKNEFPKRV